MPAGVPNVPEVKTQPASRTPPHLLKQYDRPRSFLDGDVHRSTTGVEFNKYYQNQSLIAPNAPGLALGKTEYLRQSLLSSHV